MKKLIALALFGLAVAACNSGSANSNESQIVNKQQQIYANVQPVPLFDFSEQRNTLIQIYDAKNQARQTWAVIQSITGQFVYACPSVGFPIPADTELTNPQAGVGSYYPLPQAEPDGLYTSTNTDATYVLCVRADGSVVPIYTEQKVTLFPFEVKIVNGQIVDAGGDSTMTVTVKGGNSGPAPTPAPSK